jgi:hypothetical protein
MSKILAQNSIREGTLVVTEDEVCIVRHKKAQDQGFPAQTRIPIRAIANIQFQPVGFVSNGSIQFNLKPHAGVALPEAETIITFSGGQRDQVAHTWNTLERVRDAIANPILLSVKGVNGQLELLNDKVRIRRKGGMAVFTHGLKGDKEILLSSISSIQFRPPGAMTNGFIQFAFHGGKEAKGALFQATQDENSIMFSTAQLPAFQQMKQAIEQQRAKLATPAPSAHSSGLDDLERLASLRDRGIITNDEFEAKKRQILGL